MTKWLKVATVSPLTLYGYVQSKQGARSPLGGGRRNRIICARVDYSQQLEPLSQLLRGEKCQGAIYTKPHKLIG